MAVPRPLPPSLGGCEVEEESDSLAACEDDPGGGNTSVGDDGSSVFDECTIESHAGVHNNHCADSVDDSLTFQGTDSLHGSVSICHSIDDSLDTDGSLQDDAFVDDYPDSHSYAGNDDSDAPRASSDGYNNTSTVSLPTNSLHVGNSSFSREHEAACSSPSAASVDAKKQTSSVVARSKANDDNSDAHVVPVQGTKSRSIDCKDTQESFHSNAEAVSPLPVFNTQKRAHKRNNVSKHARSGHASTGGGGLSLKAGYSRSRPPNAPLDSPNHEKLVTSLQSREALLSKLMTSLESANREAAELDRLKDRLQEMDALKAHNAAMAQQMAQQKEELMAAQQQVQSLGEDLARINGVAVAAHSALDHEKCLRHEAELLLTQQQESHAQTIAALKVEDQAAAEALQLANEQLANDVRVAREECSRKESEAQRMKETAEREKMASDKEVQEMRRHLWNLTESSTAVKAELASAQRSKEYALEKVATMEAQVRSLEGEHKKWQEQQVEINAAASREAALSTRAQKAEDSLAQARAAERKHEEDIAEMKRLEQERAKVLQNQIEAAANEAELLRADLASTKEEHESEKAKLRSESAAALEEAHLSHAETRRLQQLLDQTQAGVAYHEDRVRCAEQRAVAAECQVVSAKEALQEARTQSQASAHVASQEHETALQRERDKAAREMQRLTAARDASVRDLASAQQESANLREAVATAERTTFTQLMHLREEAAKLRVSLAAAEEEKAEITEQRDKALQQAQHHRDKVSSATFAAAADVAAVEELRASERARAVAEADGLRQRVVVAESEKETANSSKRKAVAAAREETERHRLATYEAESRCSALAAHVEALKEQVARVEEDAAQMTQAKRDLEKKVDRLKSQQRSAPDTHAASGGRLGAWHTSATSSSSSSNHDNTTHDASAEGRLLLNRLDHRPRDWNLHGSASATSSADNSAAPSRSSSPGDNGTNGSVWWGVHRTSGSNGSSSERNNLQGENSSTTGAWIRKRPPLHSNSPGSEPESAGAATVETVTSEDGGPTNSMFSHVRSPLGASPGSDSGRSREGKESPISDGNHGKGSRQRRRSSKGSSPSSMVLSANAGWAESLQRLLQRRPSSKSLGLRPSSTGSGGTPPLAPLNKTSPAGAIGVLSPSSIASPPSSSSSSSSPSSSSSASIDAGSILPAPIAAPSTAIDHNTSNGDPHNDSSKGIGQRNGGGGGSGIRAAGAVRSFNREEWEFAWGNDTVFSPTPKSEEQASKNKKNLSPRNDNNDDSQSKSESTADMGVKSPSHNVASSQETNPTSSEMAAPRSPLSPTRANRANSQPLSPPMKE